MDSKQQEEDENKEFDLDRIDQNLHNLISSCKSLSNYENTSWRGLLPQIIASLIATSFVIINGTSLAYSAVIISQLSQNNSNIVSSDSENSWIASVVIVAGLPAALMGGILMDTIGRVNILKLVCIPGVIGWMLIATAQNIFTIIVGRFLVGVAGAWGVNCGTVYITEIANADIRMSLISVGGPYMSVGMILMYFGGWVLEWRQLAWIAIVFCLVPSILCFTIPDSPPWLVLKGKTEQAHKALQFIHKRQQYSGEHGESFAELHLKILEEELRATQKRRATEKNKNIRQILRAFLKPTAYKPIIILSGFYFFNHFSGLYSTSFYSVSFMEETGANIDGYIVSMILGLVRLIMTTLCIYLLKLYKRRFLLLMSCTGMAVSMFIGGLYTTWIKEGSTIHNWVPVMAFLAFVIFTAIGSLNIPVMLIGEFLPLEIRGIGYSIIYCMYCGTLFSSIQSYFALNDYVGGLANLQFFYATMSFGASLYCYILIPETKGLQLAKISKYFLKGWIYLGRTTNNWVPAVAFLAFVMFSAMGSLNIPAMLIGEFLPLEIRGVGYSIIYCIYCGFQFLSIQSYFIINNYVGGIANLQFFYAAISFGGALYCYILIPETKGMKLVNISKYFEKGWICLGNKKGVL